MEQGEPGSLRPSVEDVERFHDSLERCLNRGEFFERFYERFFAADPRVEALFAHTDMARQRRVLRVSLIMILDLSLEDSGIDLRLAQIADRHDELAIDDDLYDVWLGEMVATASEFDPHFDARVAQAWRSVLRRGIAFMQDRRDFRDVT